MARIGAWRRCLVVAGAIAALAGAKPAAADEAALLEAVATLRAHVAGEREPTPAQIDAAAAVLEADKAALATSGPAVRAAMDLVRAFDAKQGPLWVAHPPLNSREKKPQDALPWAIFWTMQHLVDQVYNTAGMRAHADLIDGFRFGSADHFPGKVEAPIEPDGVTVKISASYPATPGSPVFHMEVPARKPTGAYLVPGTIATVVVPPALVGKGYQVRVGAHSWDHSNKPRVLRLYRVSTLFDIDSTEVRVANPLGGGVYIDVPYEADAGVVEVTVKNAVRSPYFSWKSFHRTTNEQWRSVERQRRAPWADFQSDKYMMQVPTSWVYALDDPEALMSDWDKALDVFSDVMGRPRQFGREVLYNQVDLQLRGRAFHPGYPSGNRMYDPSAPSDGYHGHHLVRGPRFAHDYEFHELGHGFLFPKWAGDRESAVNFPHVAVLNVAFGVDLQAAFRGSRGQGNPFMTVDTAAVEWMMSDNFTGTGVMTAVERQYQLKGHAKYIDIARLFGWEAIGAFFRSTEQDYIDGKPWPRDSAGEDGDRYTLRFSQVAGADLRPLIHFWGIPIVNPAASDEAFRAANIPPSAKVYDQLVAYQQLVPADNAAFRAFAQSWWGKQPSPEGYTTERNHAARWDSYDPVEAHRIRDAVQAILDRYFPAGRPPE